MRTTIQDVPTGGVPLPHQEVVIEFSAGLQPSLLGTV